mgnify:CR=1 FL=1
MLKLGPFDIDHPFILAPMAGITHSPFRRLMRRHRSAVVISELVSATGIEYAGARTLDLLKFHEEERRVGLQIFGEDQEHLVKACQYVERLGADFVDLNMGCPVPKVVKKGAGSAMCRDPIGLSRILQAMVESVKIPVTIKIRTGWDSGTRNAAEIVRVAADAGVKWVAIHGRTRAQGYSGDADWDRAVATGLVAHVTVNTHRPQTMALPLPHAPLPKPPAGPSGRGNRFHPDR